MRVGFGAGPTDNRVGTLGMHLADDPSFMDFRKGANSSKQSSGSIWRSSQPLVALDPEDQKHVNDIKQQNKRLLFGQRPTPGMKLTMGDQLRLFHYDHPALSVAAAMTSILALSTLIAVGTGYAIDALAHLTDRKNDKVGLVIGVVVGLIAALTQTTHLFALVRRTQMRMKAGAFSPDTTKVEGQAYWMVVKRSPVLAVAMRRNARSLKGEQHDNLYFLDTHVRDALELCQRYGLGKNVWSNSISEHKELPIKEERPYWRATAECKPLGIRKGYYYVSRHRTASQFLEEEQRRQMDRTEFLRMNITESLIKKIHANPDGYVFSDAAHEKESIVGLKKFFRETLYGQYGIDRNDLKTTTRSNDDTSDAMNEKDDFDGMLRITGKELKIKPDDVDEHEFNEMLKVIGKALRSSPNYNGFMARVKGHDDDSMLANSYINKLLVHATGKRTDISKSCVRVDEYEKAKVIFEGFRSASFYTWFVNLRDSISAVLGSATDGVDQGLTVGKQLFMFIPLTICASVVSVLLLGMTATPGGGSNTAGGNSSGNQQPNNGLNLEAYPAYQHGQAMLGAVSSKQLWGTG